MTKKTTKRKKINKVRKLTPKQAMFVKEYLIDLNATQAAIRAGYSKKTANRIASNLLSNIVIQNAIAEALAKRAEKTEITAEYILEGFKEVFERCVQRVPVMTFDYKTKELVQVTETVERNGKIVEEGVWQFDSRGANTALTKLGEHLGLFKKVFAGDPDNPLFPPVEIIRAKPRKKSPKKDDKSNN